MLRKAQELLWINVTILAMEIIAAINLLNISSIIFYLQMVGAKNVLVVISRWFGGVLLGPDRFKHINNCARNLLQEHNFITNKVTSSICSNI